MRTRTSGFYILVFMPRRGDASCEISKMILKPDLDLTRFDLTMRYAKYWAKFNLSEVRLQRSEKNVTRVSRLEYSNMEYSGKC